MEACWRLAQRGSALHDSGCFTVPIITTTANCVAVTTYPLWLMETRRSWPVLSHVPRRPSSRQGHILLSLLPRAGHTGTAQSHLEDGDVSVWFRNYPSPSLLASCRCGRIQHRLEQLTASGRGRPLRC